jgi:hypothetical protein
MGRARDISKVFSTGTALATDTEVSTTYQTKATAGLTFITPTSIANTGGTSSIGASGTITFTGVSNISLNNVFSSTYTNYRVLLNCTSGSGNLSIRLRSSGADNTSSVYNNAAYFWRSGGAGGDLATDENVDRAYWIDAISVATFDSLDVFNPNVNTYTHGHFQGLHVSPPSTGYKVMSHWGGWSHETNYQADGITFIFSTSGTGTLSVYGYNK